MSSLQWPERVIHCSSAVTSLDFSSNNPSQLAVGMKDDSQLELRCNGLVYSAATFPATVSSRLKPDSKKRATTNGIKSELEHEQGGEAAAELLLWSLMLQLA